MSPALSCLVAAFPHGFLVGKLAGEELKKALITQVEYIFSKEYLASDPALVAQLNHDFFLPISVVVDLPVIRLLTSDAELVKTALKSTDKIVIDEAKQMARPAIKLVQRNTIIIRDVPEATPQDVRIELDSSRLLFDKSFHLFPHLANSWFVW